MSTDGDRAARARQRAEDERREREQGTERDRERAEGLRMLAKMHAAQHRASCHRLYGLVNPGSTFVVLLVALFGAIGVSQLLPQLLPDGFVEKESYGAFVPWLAGGLFFLGVAFVTIAALAVATMLVNRVYQAELTWMRGLPFSIDGLDSGLITTTSSREMRVLITYPKNQVPPGTTIMQWLTHVDPGGSVESHYDRIEIKARIAGEPEGDLPRIRARRMLFRDLVDGVLMPLHAQAPFSKIELRH